MKNTKYFIISMFAVTLFFVIGISSANAATYYVSTTGNNANDGLTESSAWRTITYAATQAQAGNLVRIKGGNYGHEHVVIGNSGTSGNPITFQGYDGEVIINGADGTGYGIYINNKEYITIDGFKITRYQFGILGISAHHVIINDSVIYLNYKGIAFQGTGGHDNTIQNIEAYNNEMHNVELRHCTNSLIKNCWSYSKEGLGSYTDYAYAIQAGSKNNLIQNCIAGQHAADGGHYLFHGFAFRHDSSHNQVINCKSYYTNCEHYKTSENSDYNEFINCFADGEYAPKDTTGFNIKSSNNIIRNCIAKGVDHGALVMWSTAEPSTQPVQDNVFQNCVFMDNTMYGVYISNHGEASPPTNNVIKNCIVSKNESGIRIAAPGNTIRYNNVWDNTNNYVGCLKGVGDISTDPLFANLANNDYHLKSKYGRWDGGAWVTDSVQSPAIDAGDPTSGYSDEQEDNGDRINVGAYGGTDEASLSGPGTPAFPIIPTPTTPTTSTTSTTSTTPPPPDTAAPTVPANLEVHGSIYTKIGLEWTTSMDNIAVAGYRIFRDGIEIATTNATYYNDGGISYNITYVYTVSAYDAAGNESTQSSPASAISAPLNVKFEKTISVSDFTELVGNTLSWVLSIAGSLALLIIIGGGVMYMTSVGDEQKVVQAKKIVYWTIIGLILILVAYSAAVALERILN